MDDVLEKIAQNALVPAITIPDAALAVPLVDAFVAGGLPCIEITFRTPVAAAALDAISSKRADVLVGAGTVLSTEEADTAIEAGARFIVSPGFNPAVVDHCVKRSVTVLPGVVTPTEVQMALARGLRVAKFFPAEPAGGVAYLKAMAAPFGGFRFVPTGGIKPDNLAEYLALPQILAVGGSWMAPANVLKVGDFDTIEQSVRDAMELVRRLRPSLSPAGAL